MNPRWTSCEGVDCARKPVCARAAPEMAKFGVFEVTRLCYSGYSFYRQLEPFPAVLEAFPATVESE